MQNQIHPRDLIVGLQKGLALIQLFSREYPRLSVPQAAKMSGLTQSAARRFFLTLLHERYLQTDGRYYWLTPKALRLGQAYVDSAQFPRMVRPIVEYIASRTEEHASVGVIDDDELVYIARSKHTPLTPPRFGWVRGYRFTAQPAGVCGWHRWLRLSAKRSCSASGANSAPLIR
ncbi:p-hydroxybenzoate hydroxylase transcriptional activator [Raoultella terrigena]|uniref:p-hydroxybenzoate hydroxylase transcriptional activator n=1 Tax=Raoultella terrigena TaxID=577 RepID=A0A4U9DA88_RAOTE|nr:p-hydroxybenzoate hydroxylase transcriptional activator [Raoultella terrigena]